jgi:hypothetical protein
VTLSHTKFSSLNTGLKSPIWRERRGLRALRFAALSGFVFLGPQTEVAANFTPGPLVTARLSRAGAHSTGAISSVRGARAQSRAPAPAEGRTNIAESEALVGAATTALRVSWLRALRTSAPKLLLASLDLNFQGHFPSAEDWIPVPDDGFELAYFKPTENAEQPAEAFTNALFAHVSDWTHVELASFKFYRFTATADAGSAVGAAHLTLAGPRIGGGRAHFEADVELDLLRSQDQWRVRSFTTIAARRSATQRPVFRDISDRAGFRFNQSEQNERLNQEFVNERRMLTIGGVNALDWNRDGFPDLLATRRDQLSVLFQNDGQGGFERVELPFPIPQESAYAYIFLDLDGDRREELVVGQVQGYGDGTASLPIYTRRKGTDDWTRHADGLSFRCPTAVRGHSVQGIDAADVDQDGRLDLVLAMHSDSRSGGQEFNQFRAFDGGENKLFMNEGRLVFRDATEEAGIHGRQYSFLARFFDFDSDGDADLFEGNDFGPNWLWRNDGSGHFTRDDGHPLSGASAYTMGFSVADLDGGGSWTVSLSNMYSHAGNRIVPHAQELSEQLRADVLASGMGNQLWTQDSDLNWQEEAHQLRINEAGWAWASVFIDIDADGDQDLFVTNGNTSNEDATAPDW